MGILETVVLLCIIVAVSMTGLIIRDAVRNKRAQFDSEAPTLAAYAEASQAIATEPSPYWRNPAEPSAFTLRPNRDNTRPQEEFAAQDYDGEVKFFEKRPIHEEGQSWWWSGEADICSRFQSRGPANPNWRQAIEQRPAKLSSDERPTSAEVSRAVNHLAALKPAPLTESDDAELVRLYDIAKAASIYLKTGSATAEKRLRKALGVVL